MSVNNGEKADANNFNTSFVSREDDDNKVGKFDLENTDAASGASVSNVQREHNSIASFVGKTTNVAENEKPSWTSDNIGSANDPVKDRVDSIQTVTEANQAGVAANLLENTSLRTQSGTNAGDDDLGTFSGATISDNTTVKNALQELETKVETLEDGLDLQGLWDASTNTPTLSSGVGNKGEFYIVSVAGSTNLDGETNWSVGDWALFDGAAWVRVDNNDAVNSVFGRTGMVTAQANDYTWDQINKTVSNIGDITNVDTSGIADGEVLVFNQSLSRFEPGAGGAGSGVGGVNFIDKFNFESADIGDWSQYQDAASGIPVDGDGGSPTITSARTTTAAEVIVGDGSLKLTKDVNNRQGEGWVKPFTIDTFFTNQTLFVRFKYKVVGGSYGDAEVKMFVYDVTNSQVISVTNDQGGEVKVPATNGSEFIGSFPATDSESYRLLFHIAGTSVSAYDISIDDVVVGPDGFEASYIGSDWEAATLTLSGLGSGGLASTDAAKRRVGDSYEYIATFVKDGVAGTGGSPIQITIDEDIDFTTIPSSNPLVGDVNHTTQADASTIIAVSTNLVQAQRDGTTSGMTGSQFGANSQLRAKFTVPVQNNKSTNLISTFQSSVQNQVLTATLSGNQAIASSTATNVLFDTAETDAFGAVDTANNKIVVPEAGIYEVKFSLGLTGTNPADRYSGVVLRNSLAILTDFTYANGAEALVGNSKEIFLTAGDDIEVTIDSGVDNNYTVNSSVAQTYITIKRIPDFKAFGVVREPLLEVIESAAFPVSTAGYASGEYMQMTGNSIDLLPGQYLIDGTFLYVAGAGDALTTFRYALGTSNGDNTSTLPPVDSSKISFDGASADLLQGLYAGTTAIGQGGYNFTPVIATVFQDVSLFAVGRVTGTLGAGTVTTKLRVVKYA